MTDIAERGAPRASRTTRACLALALAAAALPPARAADPPPADAGPHWVATWAAAAQPDFPGTHDDYDQRTIRLVVRGTIGGPRARITLSNAYGDRALEIDDAHLARLARGTDIDPASDVALTFGGRRAVVVPPHASVTSDAAAIDVPALADLAVSLHFPAAAVATTVHALTLTTNAVSAPGDVAGQAHWTGATPLAAWPFLTGVDVEAPAGAFAVVAIGDSLVDGDGTTPGAHRRWVELLAERLQHAGGAAARVGVVNEGLIGNRLRLGSPCGKPFGPAFGESVLDRLDRDALQRAGVRVLIVRAGANDLGLAGAVAPASEAPTADELVAALGELVARAHAHGVRVIGATLSPFEGATLIPGYSSPAKEAVREQVNARIRAGGVFDEVIDADALLRDPGHPSRLAPGLDHGDHLHPNDAGNAAFAQAIPLGALGVSAAAPR